MAQPTESAAGSHGADAIVARTQRPPRSRVVSAIVIGLLLFVALGGANLASSLLGCGYVATSSWLANTMLLLALALTPLFLTRLLDPAPSVPSSTTRQTLVAAAASTVRDLGWLLLLVPFLLVGGSVAGGFVDFLLFREGRYVLLVLLVVGIVQSCRRSTHCQPTRSPVDAPWRWRALLGAMCWLWLLTCLGLLASNWLHPWESIGTDPHDGSRYFARRLQRDTPMERRWLLVATPLGGDAIAWHNGVAIEPSLPIDLTTLTFEDGAVFAQRRDGPPLRLALR